ncbi:MAG: (Fe-S)-binding protein [Thermoplasmata archaeon]|nr:MAG: (Fe-S)-binding protein [Thermoplasmata archaeon]
MKESIKSAFKDTKAYYCLECGKCTSACPVSIYYPGFSPRLLVKKALLDFEGDLLSDKNIWDCLTCNICNDVCMSDVQLPEFIRAIRSEAQPIGNEGCESHCGVPHAVSRIMTNTNLTQNRLEWITKDMKISNNDGEYLLWIGCAPYHKTIFSDYDKGTDISDAALRLLNFFGISPVVLPNEKCCGHDMLWLGQRKTFEDLREQNKKAIEDAKVDRIVTTCAEGYYTLKNDYNLDAEVIHISQFLADKIENEVLKFKATKNMKVTYHDPCRLGRFAGEYDAPRKVLDALPGVEFVEMEKNRHKSPCCGVSAWINCDDFSKKMRFNKLMMAKDVDAEAIITTCPKCRIHLRCYTTNEHVTPQMNMDIEDLTLLCARSLGLLDKRR